MKRAFDFAAALVGLVLAAPVTLIAAIAVAATSRGPVFHRAIRVGKDGVPFRMFKLRTMIADQPPDAPRITRRNDPRVTPAGRRLRAWKIDELPQLVNVLRGEMSLVGPRPEDPAYVALWDDRQRRVLSVRPGITSPASLRFRHEEEELAGESWHERYVTAVMPERLALDLAYLDSRSFAGDLRVLVATLFAV